MICRNYDLELYILSWHIMTAQELLLLLLLLPNFSVENMLKIYKIKGLLYSKFFFLTWAWNICIAN